MFPSLRVDPPGAPSDAWPLVMAMRHGCRLKRRLPKAPKERAQGPRLGRDSAAP